MSFAGADTTKLRSMAAQAEQTLETIQGARSMLLELSTLVPTIWVGTDSEQFVARVNGEHLPSLNRTLARLERAIGDMRASATEQDQTSEQLH